MRNVLEVIGKTIFTSEWMDREQESGGKRPFGPNHKE